jgi:hypothetical protein
MRCPCGRRSCLLRRDVECHHVGGRRLGRRDRVGRRRRFGNRDRRRDGGHDHVADVDQQTQRAETRSQQPAGLRWRVAVYEAVDHHRRCADNCVHDLQRIAGTKCIGDALKGLTRRLQEGQRRLDCCEAADEHDIRQLIDNFDEVVDRHHQWRQQRECDPDNPSRNRLARGLEMARGDLA